MIFAVVQKMVGISIILNDNSNLYVPEDGKNRIFQRLFGGSGKRSCLGRWGQGGKVFGYRDVEREFFICTHDIWVVYNQIKPFMIFELVDLEILGFLVVGNL